MKFSLNSDFLAITKYALKPTCWFKAGVILMLLMSSLNPIQAQNDLSSDVDKLEKFLKSLDGDYVDEVETKKLVEIGIRSMLEQLDPHSVYLDAEAYKDSNEPLQGKFHGVGIRFIMVNDTMTILDVTPGGTAEMVGLRPGDQIVKVFEDTVAGKKLSTSQISERLKNDKQEVLDVFVKRKFPLAESFPLRLRKDDIEIKSVPAHFLLENKVGYLKLDRFSANSLEEFRNALNELQGQRMKSLILDLRGNGGGYLNVAIKIADEFLEDRKLIVYTEGLHQNKKDVFATSGGNYTDGELYVLIDANSASASEILAGAIQDWDRGLIIGRRSYGKGLVQRTVEFSDGSAVRLTISRYYTPAGRSIQRSYENGVDAYRSEIRERYISGELFEEKAIQLADSQIFYTANNRKVYGGGGIIPDVFIPLDTTLNTDVIDQFEQRELLRGFALDYAGLHANNLLTKHKNVEAFVRDFAFQPADWSSLSRYMGVRGVEIEASTIEGEEERLERLLKPAIARSLYGYESYFWALSQYDTDIKAALQEIDRGTFKELGLK